VPQPKRVISHSVSQSRREVPEIQPRRFTRDFREPRIRPTPTSTQARAFEQILPNPCVTPTMLRHSSFLISQKTAILQTWLLNSGFQLCEAHTSHFLRIVERKMTFHTQILPTAMCCLDQSLILLHAHQSLWRRMNDATSSSAENPGLDGDLEQRERALSTGRVQKALLVLLVA